MFGVNFTNTDWLDKQNQCSFNLVQIWNKPFVIVNFFDFPIYVDLKQKLSTMIYDHLKLMKFGIEASLGFRNKLNEYETKKGLQTFVLPISPDNQSRLIAKCS